MGHFRPKFDENGHIRYQDNNDIKLKTMEITGKIKFIGEPQQVSSSFLKREVVITTDEQYPQHILIEFTQDRASMLDHYNSGEDVKVSINLRGREWVSPQGETRYFNTIQGWRIEKLNAPGYTGTGSAVNDYESRNSTAPEPNFNEEEHDDLPF